MQAMGWIGLAIAVVLVASRWIGHITRSIQRDPATGATRIRFNLQIGKPGVPAPDAASHPGIHVHRDFHVTLSSLPAAQRPDAAAVDKAAGYQRDGHDWDSICRWVSIEYGQLTPEKQRVYLEALKGMVALRKLDAGAAAPISGSSPPAG